MAHAIAILRALGLVLRKVDGEYRVNFRGGSEATAYYTTDLSDAIVTGRSMAASKLASDWLAMWEAIGNTYFWVGQRPALLAAAAILESAVTL